MTTISTSNNPLPRGIFPLLETPFHEDGTLDYASFEPLVEDVVRSGVGGILAPLVASEVHALTIAERRTIVETCAGLIGGRLPFVVGASSDDVETCRLFARLAEESGCAGYLVAVPMSLYGNPDAVIAHFRSIVSASAAPLILQDLQWNGPGLDMDTIRKLRDCLPTLVGMKIETAPAGSKYTAVREAMGPRFHISGGWAIPQLIEALDRGVDAMVPEAALVHLLNAVYRAYAGGDRPKAQRIFRELIPVLAFSNQELYHSIAFFKRLLTRKGLLRTAAMRDPGYRWDRYNVRIADEWIDYYLELEDRYRTP